MTAATIINVPDDEKIDIKAVVSGYLISLEQEAVFASTEYIQDSRREERRIELPSMFHFLVAVLKHQKTGSLGNRSMHSAKYACPLLCQFIRSCRSFCHSPPSLRGFIHNVFRDLVSVEVERSDDSLSYSFSQMAWVLSQTKLFLLVGGVVRWPDPQGFVLRRLGEVQ